MLILVVDHGLARVYECTKDQEHMKEPEFYGKAIFSFEVPPKGGFKGSKPLRARLMDFNNI